MIDALLSLEPAWAVLMLVLLIVFYYLRWSKSRNDRKTIKETLETLKQLVNSKS